MQVDWVKKVWCQSTSTTQQGAAESWRRFTLYDTEGKVLIHIGGRGRLHRPFGLSELFLEASEPAFTDVPFNVFKRRFPEGTYRFRGSP